MDNSNKLAKISLVVSACGVLVALSALGLSVYMGWLQKNNYEVSVQPYITLVPTVDMGKKFYGYYLYNAGMGKGYIEEVQYFLNDQKLEGDNKAVLEKVVDYFGFDRNCFAYGNPRKGDSVSLDDMNILPSLSSGATSLPQCKGTIEEFHKDLTPKENVFSVKLKYRSIYGISYLYNSRDNSQKKL